MQWEPWCLSCCGRAFFSFVDFSEFTAQKHQTVTFLSMGTLPSISCHSAVPGSAVMGFYIVMIFEVGGESEIAK